MKFGFLVVEIMLLLMMQSHMLLTIMWPKSKSEAKCQHGTGSRLFSKAEACICISVTDWGRCKYKCKKLSF